jgi:hypothetical protein
MSDTIFNKEDFNNIFGTTTGYLKPDPLVRNAVLEEVALEFDAMRIAFGDTADSFARYVREMKS